MSQIKSIVGVLALCLVLASAAPTEPEASSTTSASAAAPTTPAQHGDSETGSASTASMPVSSTQDQALAAASLANTTFTCYDRKVGYYADTEASCKVYHFCMLGDYNGQEVYQRVSYLCLNETTFDQQALDCVEPAKMTAPCAESAKYYDESNAILRKAIIGKSATDATPAHDAAHSETSTQAAASSDSASSSSAPADAATSTTTPAPTASS